MPGTRGPGRTDPIQWRRITGTTGPGRDAVRELAGDRAGGGHTYPCTVPDPLPATRWPRRAAPAWSGVLARSTGCSRETYPDARCELDFDNPFQLLVVTVLSAQTTDKRVNAVRPDAVRGLPRRPGDGRGRPREARGHHRPARLLPRQDRVAAQAERRPGRAARRRGAAPAQGPGQAARRRPQDRQRRARQRVRHPRHHRRHPLRAARRAGSAGPRRPTRSRPSTPSGRCSPSRTG